MGLKEIVSTVASGASGGWVVPLAMAVSSGLSAYSSARTGQAAAEASVEATRLQVDELRRQFDYQQSVLLPRIQLQYAASGAFADLLGIGNNNQVGQSNFNPGAPPTPGVTSGGQPISVGGLDFGQKPTGGTNYVGGPRVPQPGQPQPTGGTNYVGGPRVGQPGQDPYTGVGVRPGTPPPGGIARPGQPPAMGDVAGQVAANYATSQQGQYESAVAGIPPGPQAAQTVPTWYPPGVSPGPDDPNFTIPRGETNFVRDPNTGSFIDPNVNPRSLEALARENEIYGSEFTESPGYQFQVEEMNRSLDRRRSAGGNYGGRAVIEAQRRAGGIAAGEYYNYAAGREREVGRIETGAAVDLGRQDQSYQNYLANLRAMSGFGDVAGQAVSSSAATAGAISSAIGAGAGRGTDIITGTGTNIHNAIVSGQENVAAYYQSQRPYQQPPPGGIA